MKDYDPQTRGAAWAIIAGLVGLLIWIVVCALLAHAIGRV